MEDKEKPRQVGKAVEFEGWGQGAEKGGSEGSSPKVVWEAEEPCLSQAALAPLPSLWLWWITLIGLRSLGFVYLRSRDTTVHWVLPVYSGGAEGPSHSLGAVKACLFVASGYLSRSGGAAHPLLGSWGGFASIRSPTRPR